jgi:ferredoxin
MPYIVIESLCQHSKRCLAECPLAAITFDEVKQIAFIDPTLCTDCGSCADVCPKGAITGQSDE